MKLKLFCTLLLLALFTTGLQAQQKVLSIKVETTNEPDESPKYANKTLFAAWIEDLQGNFVKTLAMYSQNTRHRRHLTEFTAKNPSYNTMDAVTGATLAGHTTPITASWDRRDVLGNFLPKGKYVLKCEQTSHNGKGPLTTDTIDISSVLVITSDSVAGFKSRVFTTYEVFQSAYNEKEITALKVFLRLPSAEAGKTNGLQLGLSQNDIDTWDITDTWLTNLQGIIWDTVNIKKINWANKKLAGNLNLSDISGLEELVCNNNKLTGIQINKSASLTLLACENNSMKFSTLPSTTAATFTFNNQDTLQGGIIACTDSVDLRTESKALAQFSLSQKVTLDCNEKNGFMGYTMFPDYSRWFYYSLKTGELIGSDTIDKSIPVDTNWQKRLDWDIAFHGGNIKTNGGLSGNGQGGVIKTNYTDFYALTSAPSTGYKQDADTLKNAFFSMKAMPPAYCNIVYSKEAEGWAATSGMNFTVNPTVLAIKTAEGKYAKVWMKSFANQAGDNGYITFEYVYNDNGTDLSYMTASYENTDYKWFDITTGTATEITQQVDNNNGKFGFTEDLAGKTLRCQMTNAAYPGFALVYDVQLETLPLSTDSTLKSLAISKGALTPAFHADSLHYTATVIYNVDSVKITALANDDKSIVSGQTGMQGLSTGENTFVITVTAESGGKLNYTVVITRERNTMANADVQEIEKLKAFLRQNSAVSGKTNAEQLGLSIADTASWNTGNEWLLKVNGVEWKEAEEVQKIAKISWTGKKLSGHLDLSNYSALAELIFDNNNVSKLVLLGNTGLSKVVCHNNDLKFSTLPIQNFTGTYTYDPQNAISGGEIAYTETVDLKSEYSTGGTKEPLFAKEISVPSFDWGKWVYVSLKEGKVIGEATIDPARNNDAEWENRTDWDLAFHYKNIRTNSGKSGNGQGGIQKVSGNFDDLKAAPGNGYLADTLEPIYIGTGMPPSKGNQGVSKEAASFVTAAMGSAPILSNETFALKTGDGNYAKVTFNGFYFTDFSDGQTKFKYVYQPDGSINLEERLSADAKVTTYKWFDVTGENPVEITDASILNNNGIFSFTKDCNGKKLRCEMTNENFANLTLAYEVKISETTGIERSETEEAVVTIYPNPASENVNIQLTHIAGKASMTVYNIHGQKIMQQNLSENNINTFNVSRWAKGTYFIQIQTVHKVFTKKLMVN